MSKSEDLIREAFEKWISSPPYEKDIDRFPDDPVKHAWPGNYKNIDVELAWNAWSEQSSRCNAEPLDVNYMISKGWRYDTISLTAYTFLEDGFSIYRSPIDTMLHRGPLRVQIKHLETRGDFDKLCEVLGVCGETDE